MTTTTPDLLSLHAEAIKARQDAETAGVRAAASRRLNLLEMEMELADVPYTPYQPPAAAQATVKDLTDAELKSAHADAVKARGEVSTAGRKASLSLSIRRFENELLERKIEFTPYRKPGAPNVFAMSDQDLATRIHKVRQLLSRDTIRPKIKVIAERELSALETMAAERDVSISNGIDGGKLLDKVIADVDADVDAKAALDSTPRTARKARK